MKREFFAKADPRAVMNKKYTLKLLCTQWGWKIAKYYPFIGRTRCQYMVEERLESFRQKSFFGIYSATFKFIPFLEAKTQWKLAFLGEIWLEN